MPDHNFSGGDGGGGGGGSGGGSERRTAVLESKRLQTRLLTFYEKEIQKLQEKNSKNSKNSQNNSNNLKNIQTFIVPPLEEEGNEKKLILPIEDQNMSKGIEESGV